MDDRYESKEDDGLPLECRAWVAEVDQIMRRDWCIDTSDAGLDHTDLHRYWRAGELPELFVAWFAEKYDLIRFDRGGYFPFG